MLLIITVRDTAVNFQLHSLPDSALGNRLLCHLGLLGKYEEKRLCVRWRRGRTVITPQDASTRFARDDISESNSAAPHLPQSGVVGAAYVIR